MLMARRFGKVATYEEWLKPKIVENAIELLKKEIPSHKTKIKFVHFCFSNLAEFPMMPVSQSRRKLKYWAVLHMHMTNGTMPPKTMTGHHLQTGRVFNL